jgi:hypothetical protein
MATPETPVQEDQELDAELLEAIKEYKACKDQEGPGFRSLTADQLSMEMKEKLGLDALPPDIQDDILALSQKILDRVLEIAEGSEKEAPFPSWGQRAMNCAASMPSRAIMKDAWGAANNVYRAGGMLPKGYRAPLAIGSFGAYSLGAALGHMAGCTPRR